MTALIELVGVTRTFAGRPPVVALDRVDLRVDEGEYVSVMGTSGSGKSTLLNVLGLLDRPTSGRYLLAGRDTTTMAEADRCGARGAWLGFVFQAFHLLPARTALDNVMLAGLYSDVPTAARLAAARRALQQVGLGHRLHAVPTTLSGGEQQRVAVARALAHEPRVLLCDEPTGALDSTTTDTVLDLLDDLHGDGLTIVCITHDPHVAARAGRVVDIADGRLSERTPVGPR